MANRFPLIVNEISLKIEELVSGDNLELTGNGIIISGDTGAGKYLKSDGNQVFWDSPGDVYLTQTQTLTNKTIESSVISGSLNTLTNIPNSALVNAGITINGATIPLGGSVTTPDLDTTYDISAQDGSDATEKIIRLAAGGSGTGNDDIVLGVEAPTSVPSGNNPLSLFINRTGDAIKVSGYVLDNDTITTVQSATGGSPVSGAVSIAAGNFTTVSQVGSTITISGQNDDTITRLRATTGSVLNPGNFTFLDGGATTVTQGVDGNGDNTITYTSVDTITRIRGGTTGTYTPATSAGADITITGGSGGQVTVSQSGNTISIDSQNDDTITRLASGTGGTLAAGDFRFVQAGATTITSSTSGGVTTFTISSANDDTGASLAAPANGGLLLQGNNMRLKNYSNLSGNTVMKWDSGNSQLSNSSITDDGSTVTVNADLVVTGQQTILETQTLVVEDNMIELRKGNSLVASDGGIQLNRTTDGSGNVSSYRQFAWYESGGYWRSWDGSVENRIVTENETQILTNKTLTTPTLSSPVLGVATATSINGLEITSTASATLDIQSAKTLNVDNDLTFTTDNANNNVNVNFRLGGDVVYRSDSLTALSSTTAAQLRGLVTGVTGTDNLVFQNNPNFLVGITTTSSGFNLINSGATNIQFGGGASQIDMGSTSGTTTIRHDLVVDGELTVGADANDTFTCNAVIDSVNADILIRGGSSDPMQVGRGGGAVSSNTRIGVSALQSNAAGSQNIAMGYQALLTNNSGAGNVGLGYQALRANTVGNTNVGIGRSALLTNASGDNNIAIGANALESLTAGDANVCIGHYAGFAVTGTGNVLIGPADSGNPVNDATYSPPSQGGSRQLVIGSGTEFWIRGDSNFDITLNNNVTVNNSLTVKGDLVVNGTTTTVKSNTVQISDKNIDLAAVVSTQFTCTTTDGSPNISSISPTLGLIPGMEVVSNTGGVTVPGGTRIASITGNTAVLTNNVTGAGTPTFSAIGPSDPAADGGGITVKGNTDHTWQWTDSNDSWTSSENIDLAVNKSYTINNVLIANGSQIGPSSGVFALGAAVTTSSLTSVGTLTSLSVSGTSSFTNTINIDDGTNIRFGNDDDYRLYHNATNSYVDNYTGDLVIRNQADDKDVLIQSDSSSGGLATYIRCDGSNGEVQLGHYGTTRFATKTTGADIVGTLTVDDIVVESGASTITVGGGGVAGPHYTNVIGGGSSVDFGYYLNTTGRLYSNTSGTAHTEIAANNGEIRFHIFQGGATTAKFDGSGNFLPGSDNAFDLGSTSNRWANIYSADLQLSNEGSANEVDGTWGQYTIQEGEHDLFLINRRSGKKYKFNLTEVN